MKTKEEASFNDNVQKDSSAEKELELLDKEITQINDKFVFSVLQQGEYIKQIESTIIKQWVQSVNEFEQITSEFNEIIDNFRKQVLKKKDKLIQDDIPLQKMIKNCDELLIFLNKLPEDIETRVKLVRQKINLIANTRLADIEYLKRYRKDILDSELSITATQLKPLLEKKEKFLNRLKRTSSGEFS